MLHWPRLVFLFENGCDHNTVNIINNIASVKPLPNLFFSPTFQADIHVEALFLTAAVLR